MVEEFNMSINKKLEEIKEVLENSQSPLFFFDNDQDGLCSFLLLRRYLGRGKGIAIKATPMGKEYLKRIEEFNPDSIFILDQPQISEEFFEEIRKLNLPLTCIDHHNIDTSLIPSFVNYYNSFFEKTTPQEPVTAICYRITKRKEDLWIAIVGCLADRFVPNFYENFLKEYPELGFISDNAFEIFYKSEIGKISQILGAGIKDKTSNVMKMIRFLINSKSPYEVLEETSENSSFHKRFREISKKYNALINKAKSKFNEEKVLFFKYSGTLSISAELSNYLIYNYPHKIIIVGYVKGSRITLSIRGKNVLSKILKIINKIENCSGGGHEEAIGAKMDLKDFDFFIKEVKKEFS